MSGTLDIVNGGVLGGVITADGTVNVNVTETNGVVTSNAVVVNGGYIAED